MSTSPIAPTTDVLSVPTSTPARTWRLGLAWKRLAFEWKLALTLLVALRVGLGLVGLVSMQLQPGGTKQGDWLSLIIQRDKPWSYLLSVWQRWDALWYQQIATNGYTAGNRTVHFEPLYPLLSHIVALPLGGHVVVAELLVSSVAFVIAMVLLYRLIRLDASPATARLTIVLMALFPFGFFLVAPYAESVYLTFTLAAVWFSRKGNFWLAGLAGFGAGLARWLGVFIACALAIEYLQQRRAEKRSLDVGLLAAGLPVLGILTMMAYSRFIVGDQRSLFQSNQYWGVSLVTPWQALNASRNFIAGTGDVPELLNLLCLIVFACLVIAGISRLPLSYTAYAVPYLLLLYCRESTVGSPLVGDGRYVAVLFPAFLVAAMWLRTRPWIAASWLVLSASLQAILFLCWLHYVYLA